MVRVKWPFGAVCTLFLSTDPAFDLLPVPSPTYSSLTEHNVFHSLWELLGFCLLGWSGFDFCLFAFRREILSILNKSKKCFNISSNYLDTRWKHMKKETEPHLLLAFSVTN